MSSIPPLPPELVEFAESNVSVVIGTASAKRIPAAMRGVGIRVAPDRRRLTVFVTTENATATLANAAETRRLAITMSLPITLKTFQLKGNVLGIRDALPEERELVDRYRLGFADKLFDIGMPRAVTQKMRTWPATAIDVEIVDVFEQTPGPGAGARMALPPS